MGYSFSQGHDSLGHDIFCGTLNSDIIATSGDSEHVTGGWLELAALCTRTPECVAVSLTKQGSEYPYCLKAEIAGLQASAEQIPGACLGILVKD